MKRADPQEALSTCVSRFLFKYWLTPHSTAEICPAELLLGCRPCSHFDFMLPNLATKVQNKQFSQKTHHDKRSKHCGCQCFEWLLGTVINSRGPVSYKVKLSDGRLIKRHVDHLRKTEVVSTDHETTVPELIDNCIPIQSPGHTTTTAQPLRVQTAPDRLTYPSK